MKEDSPCMERKITDTNHLKEIAIFLEGIKAGKGNIQPLGTVHLESLWNAIHELRQPGSTHIA